MNSLSEQLSHTPDDIRRSRTARQVISSQEHDYCQLGLLLLSYSAQETEAITYRDTDTP